MVLPNLRGRGTRGVCVCVLPVRVHTCLSLSLSVCVCVYVCVSVSVCLCACLLRVYTRARVGVRYLFACVCACVRACVCVCALGMCAWVRVACVCISTHMCVSVYVYVLPLRRVCSCSCWRARAHVVCLWLCDCSKDPVRKYRRGSFPPFLCAKICTRCFLSSFMATFWISTTASGLGLTCPGDPLCSLPALFLLEHLSSFITPSVGPSRERRRVWKQRGARTRLPAHVTSTTRREHNGHDASINPNISCSQVAL